MEGIEREDLNVRGTIEIRWIGHSIIAQAMSHLVR